MCHHIFPPKILHVWNRGLGSARHQIHHHGIVFRNGARGLLLLDIHIIAIASTISFVQPSWFSASTVRNGGLYFLILISWLVREKNKVWAAQVSMTLAASCINTASALWWIPLNLSMLRVPGGSLKTAHSFELFPLILFFCTTWILMPTFPVDDIDPSVIFFGSSSAWGRYRENPAYNCTLTWLASGGTAKIFFIGELFNAF